MKLGVLASGRGSNLRAIVAATRSGVLESEVRVVLSDVADAPALRFAREAGIPAHHVDPGTARARLTAAGSRAFVERLEAHEVDLVLLAGFMRIVGRTFFRAFGGRILNVHPSLLPSFRGLDAQRQALEAGVKIAGCTVHVVVPDVDAGPIVAQAAVPVRDDDTVETLSARILEQEHRIYVEAVRIAESGGLVIDDGRVGTGPRPAGSTRGEER